ncbi:hypothetical protein Tco_0078010 [Tanacetum coccineum]
MIEKKLKKLTPAEIQAQAQKLAKFEEKRAKMLKEYNYYITHWADQLPITKISNGINNHTKEETMRIERNNQPLNRMHRNLIPPQRVIESRGLVITKIEAKIFFSNGNSDLDFQRENEFHLAITPHLIRTQSAIQRNTLEAKEMYKKMKMASTGIEGPVECKASASNLKCIQVKDIVKEVKDYLNTYSSARMDINWRDKSIKHYDGTIW